MQAGTSIIKTKRNPNFKVVEFDHFRKEFCILLHNV